MSIIIIGVFLIAQVVGDESVNNPNHYFEYSINYIKEDLNKRISESNFHHILLNVHINVNSNNAENAINREIEKISKNNNKKCQEMLNTFKENSLKKCRLQEDFVALEMVKSKFSILNYVACITEEICEKLNPLRTQEFSLINCQLSKIADLRLQTLIVTEEFETSIRKIFENNDECIRGILSSIFNDVANISHKCKNLK